MFEAFCFDRFPHRLSVEEMPCSTLRTNVDNSVSSFSMTRVRREGPNPSDDSNLHAESHGSDLFIVTKGFRKWFDPREFAELFGSQSSSRYRSHSLDKGMVVVLYPHTPSIVLSVLYPRTELPYVQMLTKGAGTNMA